MGEEEAAPQRETDKFLWERIKALEKEEYPDWSPAYRTAMQMEIIAEHLALEMGDFAEYYGLMMKGLDEILDERAKAVLQPISLQLKEALHATAYWWRVYLGFNSVLKDGLRRLPGVD